MRRWDVEGDEANRGARGNSMWLVTVLSGQSGIRVGEIKI
jgi:hypothetical protein